MIDPNVFLPSKAFLSKGVGRHKEKLTSFELALREAGVAQYNLVRVSSIWPPHCELVSSQDGVGRLRPGQVVFAVVAEASTNEPSRLATAAIGLARFEPAYLGAEPAGDYAEDLAASMLATVLGVPFDPDQAWDERREQWRLSGEIVDSMNISCSAEAQDDGRWVTVVSAVVFCG